MSLLIQPTAELFGGTDSSMQLYKLPFEFNVLLYVKYFCVEDILKHTISGPRKNDTAYWRAVRISMLHSIQSSESHEHMDLLEKLYENTSS